MRTVAVGHQGLHAIKTAGQDPLSRLPKVLLQNILSFLTFTDERLSSRTKCLRVGTSIVGLPQAQCFADKLRTVLPMSQICKSISMSLNQEPQIQMLTDAVMWSLKSLQDGPQGAELMHDCVREGVGLKLLARFFTQNPQALFNHATDPERNNKQKTILHSVCSSERAGVLSDFTNHILKLGHVHRLGLLRFRDGNGKQLGKKESWLSYCWGTIFSSICRHRLTPSSHLSTHFFWMIGSMISLAACTVSVLRTSTITFNRSEVILTVSVDLSLLFFFILLKAVQSFAKNMFVELSEMHSAANNDYNPLAHYMVSRRQQVIEEQACCNRLNLALSWC